MQTYSLGFISIYVFDNEYAFIKGNILTYVLLP